MLQLEEYKALFDLAGRAPKSQAEDLWLKGLASALADRLNQQAAAAAADARQTEPKKPSE